MENILYFEGAGMDYKSNSDSNVGNYRIRTAFKNNNGIGYYIELGRCSRYDYSKKKPKLITEWALRIDHLFKIEDRYKDDLINGGYEIKTDFKELRKLDYTKENIIKWINHNLNCSFDTMEVLNDFYGYRVHGDKGHYNLMEDIELNHKRAKARKEAYEKIDMEYRKICNSRYSVIGLLEMEGDRLVTRCHASKEAIKDHPRIKEVTLTY